MRTLVFKIALTMLTSSLILQVACTVGTTGDSSPVLETVEPTTSILEGIEIVETIPPTAEGDEPEPLNTTGPRRGGVLAAPMTWCPIHDPAIDSSLGLFGIDHLPLVTEIHAGLTKLSDDVNAPVQLELADSYDVRENGILYEFVLRQDLKFSDGSPLNASDVKWSWERALGLSVTAGRAMDVFGLIEGASAVIDGESSDLMGVIVVDDRTLKIRLTQPRAEFTSLLADPVASVLKKDNVLQWMTKWEGDGSHDILGPTNEENLPVGAGPFKLTDYWIGSEPGHCAIARNPHYWGRPAYLDGVWFRLDVMKRETETTGGDVIHMVETDPLAFVNEETDYESTRYVVVGSEAASAPIELIEVEGAEMFKYEQASTISFLVLNPAAPPLDDIRFRRALASGANIEMIRWSSNESRRLITEDLTTLNLEEIYLGYDTAFAQSEVASSKYSEHADQWEVGFLEAPNWGLGYDVNLIFDEWSDLLNIHVREGYRDHALIDEYDGRKNTDYHIRIFHENPAYPDPSTVLRAIVAPFGEIRKATEFVKLKEMINTAAVELDNVKRHEMYLEIEDYLADQALVIPIEVLPTTESYRIQPWVHDFAPPKFPGSTFYNVWLDHRAPKRELPTP